MLQSREVIVNPNATLFKTISSDLTTTQFVFNLDKYQTEKVKQGGTTYTKISYPNEGDLYQVGKPNLPMFTRFVAISNKGLATIRVEYEDSEIVSNILVYPKQNDDENYNSFVIDNEFYSSDTQYPKQIVTLREPMILRDYRVVPVSVSPFQYNPKTKTLKIYKSIKITVSVKSGKGINEKTITHKKSRTFEKFYKSTIINYDFVKTRANFQRPCLLIIYSDNSNLATKVNILANWKKRKGFEVHTVSTAETTTNADGIHSYIQTAYDTWENPPEYVMLVGDAQQGDSYFIPTYHVDGGAGDQGYTLLEGDDILADVIIGRLSVDSDTKMTTVLQKILNYEKTPYVGNTDWYNKAILVGDPSQSGPSTISTNKYIKEVIQTVYPNDEFAEEYSGGFVNFMSNELNNGALYFNYRGYIGMSGFGNNEIENLSNGFMLPYVVDITCATGNFDTEESRSETFLFAGTPSNPKGGIAAIGTATASTHTCFNNIVSMSIYHSIFIEGINTAGGALTNAKYHLYLNYPQNPSNHTTQFSYWNNLMGDPSLDLWTTVPQQMNLTYDNVIAIGTNNILVHCANYMGNPVENAWVTVLSDDEQVNDTGYTDQNGDIILNVANAQVGTIKLTATKKDFIPVLEDITVASNYINLAISGYDIDDSQGNNDGNINPGENIAMALTVLNNGSGSINNLSATIVSHSDNITVTNDQVSFSGTINPNETATSTDQFQFAVNGNALANDKITLGIELSNGTVTYNDIIDLDINAPLLIFSDYHLPGNTNGVLDPGESSNLTVTLQNLGNFTVGNMDAVLSTETSYINITDNSGHYGDIAPGDTYTNLSDYFTIHASVELVPGMQIPMSLDLTNENGFHQQIMFNITIGEQILTDPLGPDLYGYFMYDDGDTGYASTPQYSWIELDPGQGGDGNILDISDTNDDDSAITVIDLPINFKFYGNLYNSLTVCSDGWVSPGGHEQESFMNWTIPGPGAPMPLIAPFWDDLKMQASSKILYKYYADSGMFVIEWSDMLNDYDESYHETFEVVLYDYNISPTSTGDSNILFQYKTINNVDAGDYGSYHVHHGQYATVGIQNETGTIGLEYTFNNTYPITAKPLQDNMAIAVTGQPISYEQAHLVFGSASITQDDNNNNQIDFGETIQMQIQLNNMGHQPAHNVSAIISTNDAYVTLVNNTANYPDIDSLSSAVNQQPFVFSVSPDVPNNHTIVFNLLITTTNSSWTYVVSQVAYSAQIMYNSFNILNDTNGNGILEPGEMCDLALHLNNAGGSPLKNLHATITSTDNHLIINDNNFDWPHIYGFHDFALVFKISVLGDTPEQYTIPINVNISNDSGYSANFDCNIYLGQMIEDFETGNFNMFPWGFGSNPWQITSETAAMGNYSAQSVDINDNQEAEMHITTDVGSSSQISFYYKVSSESGWDYLRFFIDNNEISNWTGEIDWTQTSFDVSPGTHTFTWKYTKDGSVSQGQDCAWVDYIEFPGSSGSMFTPPELMFDYDSFDYTVTTDSVVVDTLYLTNIGSGIVNYTVEAQNQDDIILSVNETEGSVYTGHLNYISFIVNTMGFDVGDYHADIVITDDRSTTTIPVDISVVESLEHHNNIVPITNELFASYPNPFRISKMSKSGGATIKFALKKDSDVKLDIYNLKGQKVKTLLSDKMKAGVHSVVWNGKNSMGKTVASGLYFYKLKTNNYEKIKKMILIR